MGTRGSDGNEKGAIYKRVRAARPLKESKKVEPRCNKKLYPFKRWSDE